MSLFRWCPLVASLLLLVSGTASAQDFDDGYSLRPKPRVGIGYVVNAPIQLAGGGLLVMLPALRGWGVYMDMKGTLDSPSKEPGFLLSFTSQDVEEQFAFDDLVTVEKTWKSMNIALVKDIAAETALYIGAGRSSTKGYRQYYDDFHERGISGYYWVQHLPDERVEVNLMAGVFIDLGQFVSVQLGAESAPKGFTAGLSLILPIGSR